MKKKRKKHIKISFLKGLCLFFVIILIIFVVVFIAFCYKPIIIDDVMLLDCNMKDNSFVFDFNTSDTSLFCYIGSDDPSLSSDDWNKFDGNTCNVNIKKDVTDYNLYIKNKDTVKKLNFNKTFLVDSESKILYLAVTDSKKINLNSIKFGSGSEIDVKIDNPSVASYKDYEITGINVGSANITFKTDNFEKKVTVIVTDLINPLKTAYSINRSDLTCNRYSSEQEKLLDEILKSRVEDAGYQTRAGVVAAGRFIALEFPYTINYFSENGRMGGDGVSLVDGEGRYYHEGLYLTSKNIDSDNVMYGPAPWGCSIYSQISEANRRNGLDCSGFTTWVLLNGGFDVGDIGARGRTHTGTDLNDYGDERKITKELVDSNVIKSGDMLGEVSSSDGHSAIILGIDDNYFYVAESLWYYPSLGVNINAYTKDEFVKSFETVNLMDSYYKEDGNYTAMWN